MTVTLINKSSFSTGTFTNVTNIAYDSTTKLVTLTYYASGSSTASTASYSADSYYFSILWT